ncbi:MAG: N-6 DNA methylase [Chloroflexaceae bacterium]|nr:N-6 DNA methylase [Chloroflexaceae bacterium]
MDGAARHGSRRAQRTGSYYTPDYIVEYLLEQTVGPVLQATVANQPDDAAKVQAVLAVNVVDPSMGSGHFLVALTEYIARFLVSLSEVGEDERQGATDLIYWKRRVAQSCIYGVDLNPLAVDLAKLSLWLATVAQDKPLSFLDHHLRCGNALVGAWLGQLRPLLVESTSRSSARRSPLPAPAQVSMFADDDFRTQARQAVVAMQEIEALAGDTLDEVREQARLYATLQTELRAHYERAADLTAATGFGLPLDPALWTALVDYAAGRAQHAPPQFAELLTQATATATAQRFFHWELAFPEVFFAADGQSLGAQAGFDAVIGNPPYVRQEALAPIKPYLSAAYLEVYHGVADLYVYFYQQGVRLLRQGGRLGFITSNKWFRAGYGTPLRGYLAEQVQLERIVDFGDAPIFADATAYPAIVLAQHGAPPAEHTFPALAWAGDTADLALFGTQLAQGSIPIAQHRLQPDGWQLTSSASLNLLDKLRAAGTPLGEYVQGRFYYGIKTGLNEAFVVDQATRDALIAAHPSSAELLKPFLRGRDVKRWAVHDPKLWLIFTRRGVDINKYPAIYEHLKQFKDRLMPGVAGGRKAGSYQWYEIQDNIAYWQEFEQPKIIYPNICSRNEFAWDDNQYYANQKTFIIPGASQYLLAVLNSTVMLWLFENILTKLQNGFYEPSAIFMKEMPIPDAPATEREAIGGLAEQLGEQARTRYSLHQNTRHRIRSDLGGGAGPLNQKLTQWWELDFAAFRREVGKAFKHDIPLREREEWEAYLAEQRSQHAAHTAAIAQLERELNARVYALFALSPAEIAQIEGDR